MTVNLQPVEGSSNILGIGHDPKTNTLSVAFKGGSVYHYSDVPPEAHAALMEADSKGKHLNANIVGKFKSRKGD